MNRDQQATNRDRERERENEKRACKGSAAAMAASSAKPKQGLRGKFKFSFSHLQQVASFSSLFHPMWHCNSNGHIFCVLCPLGLFEKRREW